MRLLTYFFPPRTTSAAIAKERLKIVMANSGPAATRPIYCAAAERA